MVIGSHSDTHPLMSEMTNSEISKEIDVSFEYLSQFYNQKLIVIHMVDLNLLMITLKII